MGRAYRVTDPLRHDGVDYAVGGLVDLDDTAAARLLAAGVVAALPAAAKPRPGTPKASAAPDDADAPT